MATLILVTPTLQRRMLQHVLCPALAAIEGKRPSRHDSDRRLFPAREGAFPGRRAGDVGASGAPEIRPDAFTIARTPPAAPRRKETNLARQCSVGRLAADALAPFPGFSGRALGRQAALGTR
jgi:hypothetical protein